MPRPSPKDIAEKAAQLRRLRTLALRSMLRSACVGGVLGMLIVMRLRHSWPRMALGVALASGFFAGAVLVCLLTGPTWAVAYRRLARGP
jgi:hypothetical protein